MPVAPECRGSFRRTGGLEVFTIGGGDRASVNDYSFGIDVINEYEFKSEAGNHNTDWSYNTSSGQWVSTVTATYHVCGIFPVHPGTVHTWYCINQGQEISDGIAVAGAAGCSIS